MKTGICMEGGAMRGLFTAGILDVFMENGITFDGAIGVSAGATFGVNLKSHQIGRTLRYNKKYCGDKRYHSISSWLKTGDLYNVEFCYDTLPFELDLFDTETFEKNPMEFYVVASDCKTGKPVYKKMTDGKEHDCQWIRASASMPVASRPVELDGYVLLDGGMTDAIPVKKLESLGYDRIAIIETREKSYIKKKQKMLPLIALATRRYPEVAKALARRHIMYNRRTAYISQKEAAGEFLVIRPPKALNVGAAEKDPAELQRVYDIGRQAGLERLDEVRRFLEKR